MLRFLSIVFLCIAAAVAYGLIHDQITIRISLEYFTVLHPPVVPEDYPPLSPTVLALVWGVIATWWVGLILGIILGLASCVGNRPKLSARDLLGPVLKLLLVMTFGAVVSGFVGYELTIHHIVRPSQFVERNVAPDRITSLLIAGFSHGASYAIGFLGGIVLSIWAWVRRGKLQPSN